MSSPSSVTCRSGTKARTDITPPLALGARIRELRTARGLTQRELAEPRYSRGFLAAV